MTKETTVSNEILLADIAHDLGMKEAEIIDAIDSEAGLVVAIADGTQLIIVPPETPDADGKTGVMFFTAPTLPGDKEYTGDFPVYSQPLETDPADVVGGDVYPEKGNADAILAWVAGDKERAEYALEAEQAGKGRKGVLDELAGILAQYVDPAENAEAAVEAAAGAAEAEAVS